MLGIGAISTPIGLTTPAISRFCNSDSRISYAGRIAPPNSVAIKNKTLNFSSKFPPHFSLKNDSIVHRRFSSKAAAAAASSVEWTEQTVEEPATNVKFSTSLSLPGCQSSLSLLGTGFREKVFVIVGVKVYAAGLYVNQSILTKLDTWKGRSASEVQNDAALFDTIFQAPLEKSLHIVLVRDVDGKTFWEALDEAISPRIKSPASVDESALSTFRAIFEGRPLRNATSIFLTWPDTTKMLVSLSSEGKPSGVDATIESKNVAAALFDVFLGDKPVSPSLKASVASGLAKALK